jgi:hypothetical protein
MPLVERLTNELSPDLITIEQIKAWLKIEHDLEDEILWNLREYAAWEVFGFMQNDFEELDESGELVSVPIPFNVKLACLLLISYMYEHRGNETNTPLPINIVKMLYPYKKLVGL